MQYADEKSSAAAGMAKGNPTCIRLGDKTRAALAKAAERENRTVSNLLETLIVAELRARGLLGEDEK